jgi:hypothetical protein
MEPVTDIDLRGQTLTDLVADSTARLTFTGDFFIRLESTFTLTMQGQVVSLTPDTDPLEAFSPMQVLVERAVTAATISDDGTLTLTFDDGSEIVAQPDIQYEAWTLTGPNRLIIVCMPGGDLAVWDAIAPADADVPSNPDQS